MNASKATTTNTPLSAKIQRYMNTFISLKELRKSKGKTQEEIAEILGLTKQAISKIETEKNANDMLPSHKLKLANHFRVSINEMFGIKSNDLKIVGISFSQECRI